MSYTNVAGATHNFHVWDDGSGNLTATADIAVAGTPVSATAPFPVMQGAYSANASVTRPANTTAYAAGDVIGPTGGGTSALSFASVGLSGAVVTIVGASLEIDDSALIASEAGYRLYLYNVTPPSALADNAAFDLSSGDRASFLGYIDLGTPLDLGSTLYVQSDLAKAVKLSGTGLFGYLVTVAGYTPTSGRGPYKVTLLTAG